MWVFRVFIVFIIMAKSNKILFKQPKSCLDCGEEITGRAGNARRCTKCLGPVYLARLEQAKERNKLQRRGLYSSPARPARVHAQSQPQALRGSYLDRQLKLSSRMMVASTLGREYIGQAQSRDGKSYSVNYKGRWVKVKKVCDGCRRDDSEVKGKWAPVYSELNSRGVENRLVLLCLGCYDRACEEPTGQQREAS